MQHGRTLEAAVKKGPHIRDDRLRSFVPGDQNILTAHDYELAELAAVQKKKDEEEAKDKGLRLTGINTVIDVFAVCLLIFTIIICVYGVKRILDLLKLRKRIQIERK